MSRLLVWALMLGAHVVMADPRSAAVSAYSFPNGPTALLAPDSLAGSVHLGVWYAAGSRNDPSGRAGLAYVLERSALGLPADVRRPLELAGASFDRTVTPDVSSNSVALPAERLDVALNAMAANVASPGLSDSALRDGIEGARAERSRRLAQTPLLPGIEQVCASLFAGHGYAAPSSGLEDQLSAITLADARRDLAARFAPSQALVTVTGRFDPHEALAVLQARFGTPVPAGARPAPAAAPFGAVVPRAGAGVTPLPVPVVLAGWRLPPDRDPDSAALEVLFRTLTAGPHARIERALVEREAPFIQVQGSFERRGEGCVFVLAAALKSAADTAQVESKLANEVERWGREPLTASELEPAQRAAEAEMLVRAQAPPGRAEALAAAQVVDGDWHAWEARIARLRALTPEDVQRAASRSLVAAHRVMVWTAPASRREEGQP